MFTWNYDATDGVWKNHALSNELLKIAARDFVLVRFTKKQPNFGAGMGQSVTLPYYKALDEPDTPQLDERMRVPIDELEMAGRSITVVEWGRGCGYTNLADEFSKVSPKEGGQKRLLDQMNACMDTGAAAGFKEAKVCFTPTSASAGTIDTDGAHSVAATSNLTAAHVGLIRDYMVNDLHVPYFEGGDYIGTVATKGLRGLKNDTALQEWHKYLAKGDIIFKSEVGKVENVRFVEVSHEQALSNGVGTGSVLGEGLIFGDDAVRRVEVDSPHLRADPNYKGDFGRRKAIIWYGLVAFGSTFMTADDREARIVRIGSL
jgi:N4-gp56 family major capsid protein